MRRSIPLLLFNLLLLAACRPPEPPQPTAPPPAPVPAFSCYADVDTAIYAIQLEGTQYLLQNRRDGKTYTIPLSQLNPPADKPELEPQLELRYGPEVVSFDAGKGLTGLYLTSYEVADGGSMALAEGYDVFLMLNKATDRILPDVWRLGQTRGRHKFMGCVEANYTHLYLSRPFINDYCRIGMREESVKMDWDKESGMPVGGPYHDIGVMKWYCFDGKKWTYNPKLDRQFPIGRGCGEFPPISEITSIDVALQAYRGRDFIKED